METSAERIAKANEIIAFYAPEVRLESRRGRLWLVYHDDRWHCEKAAILNRSGCSLGCRYGALGMGGTCAQATAMLVRWVRGETRLPLSAWRYWCSPTVNLAQGRGPELLAALEATSYPDQARTGCVFCGEPRIVDWWSRDGDPTGPCCSHAGCKRVEVHL